MKNRAAHIITVVCLITATALLYFLFNDILIRQATAFEFKADGTGNNGFNREAIVYTEDGTTYVTFAGKITTDGTAEITLLSDDGNTIIHSETHTAVNSEKIDIKITDLTPQTYYILRFSSDNANIGHLFLTTEQALVERPERTIPERGPKQDITNAPTEKEKTVAQRVNSYAIKSLLPMISGFEKIKAAVRFL